MPEQTPLESEIAELMVKTLNFDDVQAAQIDPDAILADGELALDSIDVLELSDAISKKYDIKIDNEEYSQWHEAFASLRSLSNLVETLRLA